MSYGIEQKREQHGFPHAEEVAGRSIAAAVKRIDELTSALRMAQISHIPCSREGTREMYCSCGLTLPCPIDARITEALDGAK